jgi:predicted DNA-binding transcriptional regulator AlpA
MVSRRVRVIGAQELQDRLGGVSRQRVYKIAKKPGFPAPVAVLKQGSLWLTDEVDAWIKIHRPPLEAN